MLHRPGHGLSRKMLTFVFKREVTKCNGLAGMPGNMITLINEKYRVNVRAKANSNAKLRKRKENKQATNQPTS